MPLKLTDRPRSAVRALTSLRLRNYVRLLLGMHPARLRDQFPDLEMVGLSHGDVVIDVGAHVGDFSEAVLAHQPWVKIHAFEPLPAAFRILRKNLAPFGNIEFHNVALGRARGEGNFFVSKFTKASSFLVNGTILDKGLYGIDFSTEEVLRVPIVALSDYLHEQNIGRVRLLKLDVQGFELEVLAGAESVLDRIDWIYTEARFVEGVYREAPLVNDIYVYLIQRGFRLQRMFGVSHDNEGNMIECDMLFQRCN
jgi:FkbM family methyltransferase